MFFCFCFSRTRLNILWKESQCHLAPSLTFIGFYWKIKIISSISPYGVRIDRRTYREVLYEAFVETAREAGRGRGCTRTDRNETEKVLSVRTDRTDYGTPSVRTGTESTFFRTSLPRESKYESNCDKNSKKIPFFPLPFSPSVLNDKLVSIVYKSVRQVGVKGDGYRWHKRAAY